MRARALLLVAAVSSCAQGDRAVGPADRPASQPSAQPPAQDLYVSPDAYPFDENPRLLERILATPHGYFRFVNRRFANHVCDLYADQVPVMPRVNLHGDAHIEQYAVTDVSRGLTDFDDSSTGPPVIDMLRMLTSIRLASTRRGWDVHAPGFIDRFFDGYLAALDDPDAEAPLPELAERQRADFVNNRAEFLEWVKTVIRRIDDPEKVAQMQAAISTYVQRMVEADNGVTDPGFFRIEEAGLLELGIGSALDEKYLLRVRGPTAAPVDDVILEVKEVRDLAGVSCIDGTDKIDPFRILLGQSRIAYSPYEYLGYIRISQRTYWVHSWVDNYRELDPEQIAIDPSQVDEILFDVGIQLGRGHPKQIATPLDAELRAELAAWTRRNRERMISDSAKLAQQVDIAWARFKAACR